MSRPPNIVQKDDAASLLEHELGAPTITVPVRKSSRSSARHKGASSELGAQDSIDPHEHQHRLPRIEEELRMPTSSPTSNEGSLRDLAARHSITARSNPPSLRDRRPVRRRDAEANGTKGRRVRGLRRQYGTMVNLGTVAQMIPDQQPETHRDANRTPFSFQRRGLESSREHRSRAARGRLGL